MANTKEMHRLVEVWSVLLLYWVWLNAPDIWFVFWCKRQEEQTDNQNGDNDARSRDLGMKVAPSGYATNHQSYSLSDIHKTTDPNMAARVHLPETAGDQSFEKP